jgi:transposase
MDISDISSEIPNIKIERVERNKVGDFVITVISTADGTTCHRCGREITKFYGYGRETELRHLPISGHKTYIRVRPERYECPYCDDKPTTTQNLTWYDRKSPHTRAYEEHILSEPVNSTITDVHMKENVGYEAVMGIIGRRIESEVNREDINRLTVIGMDEIALKKGHNHFVTIMTSYSDGRVKISGVVSGREKQTVKDFLSEIPERLGRGGRAVCCDMYEGYINAAGEVSGNKVLIVADRFHVAGLYRKDSEGLRKEEMKRLKKKLPEKEYEKSKGAMWALRKKASELRSDGREVLRILFRHSPLLKTGYELCDDLTCISDKHISKDKAKREIGIRVEPVGLFGLNCFKNFLSTSEKRMEEITGYFIGRQTGGSAEGLDNRIRVIKRRCYGIFNLKHLFQRIFTDLEGYSLFGRYGEV